MWECNKCKRNFEDENHEHDCKEIPANIKEYIDSHDSEVRAYLYEVNEAIQKAIPDATQTISWRMPTYKKSKNIIHFAAFKNHIGLYPGPTAIEVFKDRLSDYKTSKGAIQFPYSKPLPLNLIEEIAVWCYKNI